MMRIYRYIVFAAIFMALDLSAQTSERYEQRYDLLVSQLGPAGVGIETVLDKWEAVDSTNAKMLLARFSYLYTKAQTSAIVARPDKKYLGMEPLLVMKDSLGNDVCYYQVNDFDEELYGQAVKVIDRAIDHYPDRLDYRFVKANAYIAYEKESPDMALAYLLNLADQHVGRSRPWTYEQEKVDDRFFADAMQEYCYSFYSINTPSSLTSFYELSVRMSQIFPDNTDFLNNIGSYYMTVRNDYKTALKYYSKVLKKHPEDYTAIKNSAIVSRKMNNRKLEVKYLRLLALHGSDRDKVIAESRLKTLENK
jgi:tetratricopeptide (TPR) repeat protein